MNQEIKNKLRLRPKTVCTKCGRMRSYTNPHAKCFECKRKFCYDHISCLQIKEGMRKNEATRSVCEECIEIHKYTMLE
jgi:hypothetical protein